MKTKLLRKLRKGYRIVEITEGLWRCQYYTKNMGWESLYIYSGSGCNSSDYQFRFNSYAEALEPMHNRIKDDLSTMKKYKIKLMKRSEKRSLNADSKFKQIIYYSK